MELKGKIYCWNSGHRRKDLESNIRALLDMIVDLGKEIERQKLNDLYSRICIKIQKENDNLKTSFRDIANNLLEKKKRGK